MTTLRERLAFLITGDPASAVGAVKTVKDATTKAAAETEAQMKRLTAVVEQETQKQALLEAKAAELRERATKAASSGAPARGALFGVQANQAADGAERAGAKAAQASKDLEEMGVAAEQSGAQLQTLGLGAQVGPAAIAAAFAIAGAAVVKFAEDGYQHLEELGGQIRRFQALTGASAEDASKFVGAFRDLGVDTDKASAAFLRLGREAADGGKKLAAVGVEVAANSDGSINLTETLLRVADAYQKAGGGAAGDKILFEAFGRQGAALIPVLKQGRQGLEEFFAATQQRGEVFGQDKLTQLFDAKVAMQQLRESFKAFQGDAVLGLIPDITKLSDGFRALVDDANEVSRHIGGLKNVFGSALEAIPGLGPVLLAAGAGLEHLGAAHNAAGKAAAEDEVRQQEFAQAAQQAADAAQTEETALLSLISAARAVRDANERVVDADKKVADAKAEVTKKAKDEADAQYDLTKAQTDGKKAAEDLATANAHAAEDIERVTLAAADATLKVADAQDALTIAIERYGPGSRQAQEAQIAFTQSQLDAADAAEKAKKAQQPGFQTDAQLSAQQAVASAAKEAADAAERKKQADQEDPAADLAKAERERKDLAEDALIASLKLSEEYSKQKQYLGDEVSLADLLQGHFGNILTDVQAISDSLQKTVADPNVQALINLVSGKGAPTTQTPITSGNLGSFILGQGAAPAPDAPATTRAGQPQVVHNYDVKVTAVDPVAAATAFSQEIIWASKAR